MWGLLGLRQCLDKAGKGADSEVCDFLSSLSLSDEADGGSLFSPYRLEYSFKLNLLVPRLVMSRKHVEDIVDS